MFATSNKCIASSDKCLTSSNKKLVETSALLLGAKGIATNKNLGVRGSETFGVKFLHGMKAEIDKSDGFWTSTA